MNSQWMTDIPNREDDIASIVKIQSKSISAEGKESSLLIIFLILKSS